MGTSHFNAEIDKTKRKDKLVKCCVNGGFAWEDIQVQSLHLLFAEPPKHCPVSTVRTQRTFIGHFEATLHAIGLLRGQVSPCTDTMTMDVAKKKTTRSTNSWGMIIYHCGIFDSMNRSSTALF